jgi:DNA-directed RNA polymerase subunit RPC12/RpoP
MFELAPDSLQRRAHVSMLIECPQCGQKMILHVGLVGQSKDMPIECTGCRNSMVPLVPGPIVAGPFVG